MNESEYYNTYWNERDNKEYVAPYFKPMIKFLLREISGLGNELKILEAGCGAAAFTPTLQKFSSFIEATDISSEQIKINQKRFPEISFKVIDLSEKTPFESNYFDLIWCSEVLEHLYFPFYTIQEFYRILKPGGRLLVTTPYHGLLKNVLIALFKFDKHYDPEYPHVRFFTKNSLSNLIRKAGFEKIKPETCGMDSPFRDLIIPTNLLISAIK